MHFGATYVFKAELIELELKVDERLLVELARIEQVH